MNQGAFKGQTKYEKCLVKLIVWLIQILICIDQLICY